MQRLFISILVGLFVLTGSMTAMAQDSGAIVAKVNDAEIFQRDVDELFNIFVLPQIQAQNPGQSIPDEQRKKIAQQILNQLITQTLVLQAAAANNVTVDDALIDEQLQQVKAQPQAAAVPEDQLQKLVKTEMMLQKTIEQEVVSKVVISDDEVRAMYDQRQDQFNEPEQVKASHILILVKPEATQAEKDAARKKIEDVMAQAKAGKDFAELAKQYSEDPGSKDAGGDLGFFGRGMMVEPFENAAFSLNEGDLSEIVETQFGYHLLKVTGKKSQRQVPFEEAKDRIKQGLFQQKANQEVGDWINSLRENAKIEIVGQAAPVQ